jgi:diguanylate cyclase (GGDEF)-like protein
VLEAGTFTAGEHVVGRNTGLRTLHFILPVRGGEGQIVGVLHAGLDLDGLATDLARVPLPPGAMLTIVDRNGTILVDLPSRASDGRPLPEYLKETLRADGPDVVTVRWMDGVERVVGYAPAGPEPGLGLLVAIGLDRAGAYAVVDQHAAETLAVSGAALLAALLAAWQFAACFIRRPLARLASVAERWRRGDLTARAGLRDRSEVGDLGQAFDAMADAIDERNRRLRDILESTTDSVFTLDRDLSFTFLNARAVALIAQGRELVGQDFHSTFPASVGGPFWKAYRQVLVERVPIQVEAFSAQLGAHLEVNVYPAEDGGITIFCRDVTKQHRAQEELRHLAHYDTLTGLENRARFLEIMKLTAASGASAALVLLDLDAFKHVNDTLGHLAGDGVLRDAAGRMTARLSGRGTLARLGGDEFAALLPGVGGAAEAEALVGELLVTVGTAPFHTGARAFRINASAGIVIVPAGPRAAVEMLLANADLALYHAKAAGGGMCRTFNAGMREEYEARRLLDAEVALALERSQFELHFQPQVGLVNGAVVGAEALLRWRHPTRGLLAPGAFLEALEASPCARAVGDWAIGEACCHAAAWRAAGLRLRVGVNLFGEQLRAGGLAETVEAALARWGLPPEALELELTENIALRQDEALLAPLWALRARGVGIAFDDFGTGFASLATLKRFPLTRLKIDRGFMDDLVVGTHDTAIVEAVLALGRGLGLEVIAEGVETAAQEAFLATLGCAEGQGYRYGRPMPPEAFLAASLVT